MLILAVDTSGKSLSVALCRETVLVGEMSLQQGFNHSVTQIPLLQELLRQCSVQLEEVDLFACTIGPGSFTGIRIGVSSVKAMAYALGKPVLGVSALRSLAYPYLSVSGAIVCPLIDARRGRIFAAAWKGMNQPDAVPAQTDYLLEENNWLATEFEQRLADQRGEHLVIFTGDGQSVLQDYALEKQHNSIWVGAQGACIHAANTARLALLDWKNGATGLPQQLTPNYLSPSQAERMREQLAGDKV